MDRFTQMLEKTLMPIAEKVEQNRYLSAIREGFTSIMPFLIIGSIFLLLSNLPSEALNNFLGSIFGAENIAKLGYLLEPTFNIMALLVIIGIAKIHRCNFRITNSKNKSSWTSIKNFYNIF